MRVGEAAKSTGWSSRMLRYLESTGLVVPARTKSGDRSYRLRELNQLCFLKRLQRPVPIEIGAVGFDARLRRDPFLRAALDTWLHGSGSEALDWDQRKRERLLAA